MKVAIMGAGLSGLACGIILEQNGIHPTIVENRRDVDDRFVNGEIFLNALSAPINDSIAYFAENYNIYLQPVGNIKELIIYSENEKASIKGDLGFNVIRGRRNDSLCHQMKKQLKSKIIYNAEHTYEELLKEYTHIVLATGDGAYSERLGNYKRDLTVSLKGAIVEGRFDPYTTIAWLDNTFAPMGYSYLIPMSNTEANIVIAYPDYPQNNQLDINLLFERFFQRVQDNLQQTLKIVDDFQITNYIIGSCDKPRIGNTFFVGNCFGSIMPFLGFGQHTAILSGVYAAYDLCGKGTYEELIKTLDHSYKNSLALRRSMEKLNNQKFDVLVKSLNGSVGKILLDYNKIDYLKIIGNLLKPIISVTGNDQTHNNLP
ncbi:Dehydrogenase (flavoprotein) [Natronincola peptidivorans]|uniref:Dehydrogenase (Flavoprotein) n=1 Tax=Natronincola peptidivorans TaxID=426128 RepID=A0A1I0F9R1_9FIRM|nr:NAD(P)/FAD-dependent oxidoreductase [Natronincola peptidivorans]SET54755.1 Dehydrogenase (flavoprotein) [Natronincola peptidivorans]